MGRRRKPEDEDSLNGATVAAAVEYDGDAGDSDEDGGEPIPQDTLVCALTGELKADKPEERVLQSLVEQLHREYRVEIDDMERDVKLACRDAADKKKTIAVSIA